MTFLVLAAFVAMGLVLWARLATLQERLDDLTARIGALEHWRSDGAFGLASAPRPAEPAIPMPATPLSDRSQPLPAAPGPAVASPAAGPVPPASRPTPVPAPPSVHVIADPPASVSHTPPAAPALPLAAAEARDALETRIGSRWLLYVGVIAIVIGVSYFEKLAIDNHWVTETARVVQGGLAGLLMVAGGLRFVRKGYRLYGQIFCGCGIAILYVSAYAASDLYHLIGRSAAFGVMSAITALAAWLADRQRSQGLALVAVGGGFATPFLLPSSIDAEIALFGYETILVAGTMVLARRRDWPTLNVVSYAFTALTVGAWAARFYTAAKYLTTELFLTAFCGMFLYILWECRHSRHRSAPAERAILSTAPVGYYLASLAILSGHSPALLVFLVLLSLAGVLVGSRTNARVRLAFWCAVAVPLLVWSDVHGGRPFLAMGLSAWAGVYVLNLSGLFEAVATAAGRLAGADLALLHLNGLVAFAGAYLLIDPISSAATAPVAAGLALVHGGVGLRLAGRRREDALHFGALAFTLLAVAVALQFEGVWVTGGWAAEGAGVAWLGLRERRMWLRIGGLALFALAIAQLTALQFSEPVVGQALLLNRRAACAAFVIALAAWLTAVHGRQADPARRAVEAGGGLVACTLLSLTLAASEIVAWWKLHPAPPFEPASQLLASYFVAGAGLVWLGLRRRQEWIRGLGGALLFLAAWSLCSTQMQAPPAGYVALLNHRAATGLFAVALLYGVAALHRRLGTHLPDRSTNLAVLTTAASLLTLSLLTSEIDAFWAARGAAASWSMAREGLQAIAWGGVGGFLVWRGLSGRRTWIRAIGGVLLSVAVVRLLLLQFVQAPAAYLVAANARVLAALVLIAVLYGLAYLYRAAADLPESPFAPGTVLWLLASAVTLTLLTSEITAYWHLQDVRQATTTAAADSHFAREMMLSITWAVYATLLVVVGLRKRYAPIRYFAMAVFVVTIVKVFAIDLAELDRIYRVLSVIGLGVMLLVTSYLYQRIQRDTPR